ncbi:hypothetical protein QWY75_01285 [Pontixanthobacter aestiaquae]|uniref:Uncharacterized protein n=1 Tax=Pontixanthobacter aestiaquae TaxID=1509367 RepID=A0A844Z9I3_9SPHN|nr:hypothetical protein [Pontixanthobacter aestiaquae]MDN3644833.1 hypothetical protein [Pontixanthobacter aestiaquae]MXO84164.1 hypothetical protein [Pontixanthobacter aestiaquae]
MMSAPSFALGDRAVKCVFVTGLLLAITACKPPATDDYVERVTLSEADGLASMPIDSPDTEDAVWVESDRAGRILYGEPGGTPLMALACTEEAGKRFVHITRFAKADPDAQALIALIGNGHTARLPIDAAWNGRVWLWEGNYPASSLDLNVFTGPRRIEATVPGAGSVILNPSPRPAQLVEACRRQVPETPSPA